MARSARRSRGYVVASAFSAPPTITGTAQVGQTLTATNGTLFAATFAGRKWMRDGNEIPGATGATYVCVSADVGKVIRQVTIVTLASGGTVSQPSAPTAAVIA